VRAVRSILGKLLLLVGGALIGLLCGELAARLISPDASADLLYNSPEASPLELYVTDKQLILVPNAGFSGTIKSLDYEVPIQINQLTLRGPSPENTTGTVNWMAVGDSFTMAVQVPEEKTFAGLLGTQQDVQIWNGGVDGYSTWQSTLRYVRADKQIEIDKVILTFFLGNDLFDNTIFPHQIQQPSRFPEGSLIPRDPVPFSTRILLRHSYIYAHYRVWNSRNELKSGDNPSRERWRSELAIFTRSGANKLQQLIPQTRQALTQLRDTVRERGDELIVAIAPPAFAIHTERAEATFSVVGLDAGQAELNAPNRAVKNILQQLQVPMCELTPALQAAEANGESLYFTYDGHWTEAGHAVVANTLQHCMGSQ